MPTLIAVIGIGLASTPAAIEHHAKAADVIVISQKYEHFTYDPSIIKKYLDLAASVELSTLPDPEFIQQPFVVCNGTEGLVAGVRPCCHGPPRSLYNARCRDPIPLNFHWIHRLSHAKLS